MPSRTSMRGNDNCNNGCVNTTSRSSNQQKRRLSTSDRYFVFVCAAVSVYTFVIYQSLKFAGKELQFSGKDITIFYGTKKQSEQYPESHPNATVSTDNDDILWLPKVFQPNQLTKHNVKIPTVFRWPNFKQKAKHEPIKVLHEAPKKLLLPKPIIAVGFPKSGTSTIFSFFHCNGLKSQHWFCCEPQDHPAHTETQMLISNCMLKNLIAKKPILENCGDYDVYTEINGPRVFKENGMRTLLDDGTLLSKNDTKTAKLRLFFPQHHQLDAIHKQYPNATLILNQREVGAWVQSVLEWDKGLKYQIINEFYEQNSTKFLFENLTDVLSTTNNITSDHIGKSRQKSLHARSKKTLEIIYNYHIEYIRDWVARHPSHSLVEVDITHEDAGKTLAESFGLKDDCWGHFNKKKKRRKGHAGYKIAKPYIAKEKALEIFKHKKHRKGIGRNGMNTRRKFENSDDEETGSFDIDTSPEKRKPKTAKQKKLEDARNHLLERTIEHNKRHQWHFLKRQE